MLPMSRRLAQQQAAVQRKSALTAAAGTCSGAAAAPADRRLLSTSPQPHHHRVDDLVSNYQRACWDSYLATSRGSKALFKSIDTDFSGTISTAELKGFLTNINHKKLRKQALKYMEDRSDDTDMDLKGKRAIEIILLLPGYRYINIVTCIHLISRNESTCYIYFNFYHTFM